MAAQVLLDHSETTRALGQEPDFVIHDYEIAKGEPLHAASKRRLKSMDLPRFCKFLRSLLLGMGLQVSEVGAFTSYSLRRFLPTAADILRLPEEHCLAIGNWQERPATGPAGSQPRAVHHMAQHYANDKVLTSARIKQEVVAAIYMVAQRVSFELVWDDLRQNIPDTEAIAQELRKPAWCPASSPTNKIRDLPVDSTSEPESTSSRSSGTTSDAGLVSWFQQSQRSACHLVQGMRGIRFVPYCQVVPFDAPHHARGAGLEAGQQVCRKCLHRAPLYVQKQCQALIQCKPETTHMLVACKYIRSQFGGYLFALRHTRELGAGSFLNFSSVSFRAHGCPSLPSACASEHCALAFWLGLLILSALWPSLRS